MKDVIIIFGVGLFSIFVGLRQIQNVRSALKTGIIAVGIRDTSRQRSFDRDKRPIAYHLNFWPSLFAAVALPIIGVGLIGFAIFLLATG